MNFRKNVKIIMLEKKIKKNRLPVTVSKNYRNAREGLDFRWRCGLLNFLLYICIYIYKTSPCETELFKFGYVF